MGNRELQMMNRVSVRASKRSLKAIVEVSYGDSMIAAGDLWQLPQDTRPDLHSDDFSGPAYRDSQQDGLVKPFSSFTGVLCHAT